MLKVSLIIMSEEKNIIVQSVTDPLAAKDIFFQFEKGLFLLGKPDLIGFLMSLLLLNQIGYINFRTQKQLATLMGFSEPTFIKKRKELEKMGLIEIKDVGNRRVIDLRILSRLKFFKLPKEYIKQLDYIDRAIKSLTILEEKQGQLLLTHSIYNNNINNTNNNINNNNINNTNSINSNTNKPIYTRYPAEDYTMVLNAYKKYKGVGLIGPEVDQHRRAIKTMFRANRKPKEIVDFMEWLSKHENDEKTPWVRTWTIWTVQKKIHEFVSGKLKVKTMSDDYKEYD